MRLARYPRQRRQSLPEMRLLASGAEGGLMAYATKTPTRLSAQQHHILELASKQGADLHHVPLVDGRGSQSRTVGRATTIESCVRHGWLVRDVGPNWAYTLTDTGRKMLNKARAAYERDIARR
jgi:hypothetical protein